MNGAVWVIIVAAGAGTRYGGSKQYEPLAGRRVLDWSIAAARTVDGGVVVVVPPSRAPGGESSADACVAGGSTRSGSVRAGLAAVPDDAEVVLVHDAARPLASPQLFASVVAAVRAGAAAVVPGVELVDSLRWRDGSAVDRELLVAVQTPQGFRADVLRAAHAGGADASDDATLAEQSGHHVEVIAGEITNRKITGPADLATAERVLQERTAEA